MGCSCQKMPWSNEPELDMEKQDDQEGAQEDRSVKQIDEENNDMEKQFKELRQSIIQNSGTLKVLISP